MKPEWKVGDTVIVVDNPDQVFPGLAATIVEVDVPCFDGPGILVEADLGPMRAFRFKGTYECFERMH